MRTQTLRLGGAEEPVAVPEVAAQAVVEATSAPLVNTTVVEPPAAAVTPAPAPISTPPARGTPEVARTPPPPPAVAAPAPRAAAPVSATGDWVVQLGSFGDEANARRLADRSTTVGYKATLSSYKSGGKTMYRVRVGPYQSRGQADATASALAAHGLRGQVVAAD
jgi:DedD protein